MKHCSAGLTLFECLVYLTLFCCIATSSTFIMTRLWLAGMQDASIEQSYVSLYSAFDALKRDIQVAPAHRTNWKYISSDGIIWHMPDAQKDRGWMIGKKEKIMRKEGYFDQQNNRWNAKHSSTTIAHTNHLQLTPYGQEYISYIRVAIADENTAIDEIIFLKNGPI